MTLAIVPREPTDAMVLEAELRMPQLGRLQIRMLYESMVAAAPDSRVATAIRSLTARVGELEAALEKLLECADAECVSGSAYEPIMAARDLLNKQLARD